MLIEKGLEQRFRAFFQFLDYLGHRAAAAVEFAVGTGKRIYTLFGEQVRMQAECMQVEPAVTDGAPAGLGARGNIAVHLVRATHESVGAHLLV